MISYILRFLFLIIVFYFVQRLISSVFKIGRRPRPEVREDNGRGNVSVKREQVEKDPVCGMFVAREAAVIQEKGGETYYFCSEECRDKFLKD